MDVLLATVDKASLEFAGVQNNELLIAGGLFVAHVVDVLANGLNNTLVNKLWVLVDLVSILTVGLLEETSFSTRRTHTHNLFHLRSILPRAALCLHVVLDVFNDLSNVSAKLVDFLVSRHVVNIRAVVRTALVGIRQGLVLFVAVLLFLLCQVLIVSISTADGTTTRVAHSLKLSLPAHKDELFVLLTEDSLNAGNN